MREFVREIEMPGVDDVIIEFRQEPQPVAAVGAGSADHDAARRIQLPDRRIVPGGETIPVFDIRLPRLVHLVQQFEHDLRAPGVTFSNATQTAMKRSCSSGLSISVTADGISQ